MIRITRTTYLVNNDNNNPARLPPVAGAPISRLPIRAPTGTPRPTAAAYGPRPGPLGNSVRGTPTAASSLTGLPTIVPQHDRIPRAQSLALALTPPVAGSAALSSPASVTGVGLPLVPRRSGPSSAASSASTAVARPLLPLVPRPVKLVLLLVLIANYKSLPGYWTVRTRLPNLTLQARQQAFLAYVRLSLLLLRATRGLRQRAVTISQSQLAQKLKIPALALADSDGPQVLKLGLPGARWGWMQNLAAQNFAVSPLDSRAVRVVWSTCVAFDDCEFGRDGLHMSKSAYAKNLDFALADFVAKRFAPFVADGGSVELSKTSIDWTGANSGLRWWHRYAVWVTIESWDDEQIHISARFVSRKTAADKEKESTKDTAPSAVVPIVVIEEAVAEVVQELEQSSEEPSPTGLDRVEDLSASFTTAAEFTDFAAPTTPSVSSAELESVSDADTDADVDDMAKTVKASEELTAVEDVEEAAPATIIAPAEDAASLEPLTAGPGPSRSVEVDIASDDATSILLGDDDADYNVHATAAVSYTFTYRSLATGSSAQPLPPALILASCGYGHYDAVKSFSASSSQTSRSPSKSRVGSPVASTRLPSTTTTTWDRLQRIRYAGAPDDLDRFWSGGWANEGNGHFWKKEVRGWEKA